MPRRKPKPPVKSRKPVETVRHKDKRKNIPTEELRDFVREDEQRPKKVLYPRDPDLDPQLVWKGKDAQDAAPLEVPAVLLRLARLDPLRNDPQLQPPDRQLR